MIIEVYNAVKGVWEQYLVSLGEVYSSAFCSGEAEETGENESED
jgi:hypothetical protein